MSARCSELEGRTNIFASPLITLMQFYNRIIIIKIAISNYKGVMKPLRLSDMFINNHLVIIAHPRYFST